MKFTIRKPNYQLVLSIAAILLSLCGVLVSVYQAKIARENQQMSVWPHLHFDIRRIEQDFELVIANDGVGPAIIRQTELTYAGQPVSDHITFFKTMEGNKFPDSLRTGGRFYKSFKAGDVLKAGDEPELYITKNNNLVAGTFEEIVQDSVFQFRVIYSDVYDNCWQVTYREDLNTITKLRRCPD